MSLPTKPFKWVANYTQVPNEFFEIGPYLTEPELRIMLYAIRHTIGWIEKRESREAHISVRNFANGYTLDGETYEGTHLTEVTIRKALIELVKVGLLERVGGITEIGQKWKLPQGCDAAALQKREDDRHAMDQKRTVNGRLKAKEKRQSEAGGLSDNGGYPIDENEGLSDNAPQGYEITPSSKERTTKNKEKERTTFAPAIANAPAPSPSSAPPSSSVLAGENTPGTAPTTAQGKSTAKDEQRPPIAAAPPKPNAAVELGLAFGVPPVGKKDFASYGAIARDLIDGTVPIEEFPEYVKQRRAESVEGNWRFTIHSLTTAGAISAYCQRRDALAEKIRQAHIEGQAWLEKNPQYRPRGQVPAEKRISAEQHAQLLNFKLASEKDDQ